MKGKLPHVVPLAPMARALLEGLPQLTGKFVFSLNGGRRAYQGYARAKERIDEASGVTGWTWHDLRRTARSCWGAIEFDTIPLEAKELALAHTMPGVRGTYDRHLYIRQRQTLYERCKEMIRTTITGEATAHSGAAL